MMIALECIEKHSEVYEISQLNQTVYFCSEIELDENSLQFHKYLCSQNTVLFTNEADLSTYLSALKHLSNTDNLLAHLNIYEHAYRTSQIVYAILDRLDYDTSTTQLAAHATLYHDIGKLCISQSLLNSSKRFNDIEKQYIQLHVKYAKQLLKKLDLPEHLKYLATRLAQNHHERLDGSGYPTGKKGYELSTLDRVVAVADVYAAVTENRTYRSSCDDELALSLLKNSQKFDQNIVSVLEKLLAWKKF